MTDQESFAQFWEEAVVRLLHPTQLLILEALAHLDDPVSASVMVQISDGQIRLASWDYHCKRLTTLGLLEETDSVRRRGAVERFYCFRLNGSGG